MKVETITSAILQKMSDITKPQYKFVVHIVQLILSIRGRVNFMSMSRYGSYSEQSYRLNFSKEFDFKTFNKELILNSCGTELAWIFDPSFITKSGKHTPGVGYFWSGCASAVKWGMELSSLAVADMKNHTAMHYHATPTQFAKGEDSLRTYYAQLICQQAEELQKISKKMIFDAFFSKKPFVDCICASKFILISRLQKNVYLRYRYTGEQKQGRGRKKTYGEKIDLKNISIDHFTLMKSSEEERVYEGVAHVRSLKRWCKVVIVQILKDGNVHRVLIYFSTDLNMTGQQVYDHFKIRYQIEFLFRDSKGYLGLEHTQSRQKEALEYHYNIVLTTLNVAKVAHWLSVPIEQRNAFSIADIKTQYSNELFMNRIFSIYGKDPEIEKNNPAIRELYNLGKIAV